MINNIARFEHLWDVRKSFWEMQVEAEVEAEAEAGAD